ncbi:AAA family ATPase, partial [bacterium]|nr:AAA family ATPase [bacterium]
MSSENESPGVNPETIGAGLPNLARVIDERKATSIRLVGTPLSEIDIRQPIEWVWKGVIPRNGALTIFDGMPDVGKSTLALDIAARISTGRQMPDGSPSIDGGVVIVTSESAQRIIARQVELAGGDRSRIHLVSTVGEGLEERPISLPSDLPLIRPVLKEVGAVALILDPLLEVFGGSRAKSDPYNDGDVRRGLTPVRRLCEDLNLALIGIRHPTKATSGTAMYRGGGSVAFVAVSRAAFFIAPDPTDSRIRVIANTKCNLGPKPESMAYRLDAVRDLKDVPGGDDDFGVCRIDWLGHIDRTAQELADSSETLSPEQHGILEALSNGCDSIAA